MRAQRCFSNEAQQDVQGALEDRGPQCVRCGVQRVHLRSSSGRFCRVCLCVMKRIAVAGQAGVLSSLAYPEAVGSRALLYCFHGCFHRHGPFGIWEALGSASASILLGNVLLIDLIPLRIRASRQPNLKSALYAAISCVLVCVVNGCVDAGMRARL